MLATTLLTIALTGAPSSGVSQAEEEETAPHGYVEFSKDPNAFANHSIKIFAVLEEKNRLLYIDELGSTGLRSVTVKTAPGERDFVVVVVPAGSQGGPGAPSDPIRRTRPNVTVTVEPGMTTPVKIGGFTDFVRAPAQGDVAGTKFVRASNEPEASQFRTQFTVGKPEKR